MLIARGIFSGANAPSNRRRIAGRLPGEINLDDEAVLGEKGFPDIEKVRPIIFSPEVRSYHGIGKYLGLAFAVGKDIQ